ncbi:hypothetical protein TSH58p_03425 [Azospirillum sp. TSH58]|nr:hypothetical protein TSH58p_03425 [Azospirillum sp. TSH58]
MKWRGPAQNAATTSSRTLGCWIGTERLTARRRPLRRPARFKMICGCCGVPIAETHKEWMCDRMMPVAPGQRVEPDGTVVGPDPDTDCFSIWSNGLMSKFKSWAKLVRRWLSALASGEPGKVQGVVNTGFGELHAVSGDAPKHSAVTDCKLPYKRGQVPTASSGWF